MQSPSICCIGGHDPSSGAGLSRDLAVMQDLGYHAFSVSTALTAQNQFGVQAITVTDCAILEAQFDALMTLEPPKVIKLSLVCNDLQAQTISQRLAGLKQNQPELWVIFDPVGQASAGGQLSDLSREGLKQLLSVVDVFCPNQPEAQYWADTTLQATDLLQACISKLVTGSGIRAFILKGGHDSATTQASDLLWQASTRDIFSFASPRVEVGRCHGTGCTFASAMTASLAANFELADAALLAKAYTYQALQRSRNLAGHTAGASWSTLGLPGWPSSEGIEVGRLGTALSSSFVPLQSMTQFSFYAVLPSVDWLEFSLSHGVRTAQLRLKNVEDQAELRRQIQRAVELGQDYGAQVFINDYWQIAIELGAYGVHLGQEDLDTADLQAIQKAGLRLGISTHSLLEIERAKQVKPSYIALGHLYPTTTKSMPSQPQGLSKLRQYIKWLDGQWPTVAIGGINLARAASVLNCGPNSIAVVTAITEAAQPITAIKQFLEICHEHLVE